MRLRRLAVLFPTFLAIVLAGCHAGPQVPAPGSEAYDNVVQIFYVGLAALQVGDDARAEDELSKLVKVAPGEPASWANWGVLALRQRNYDAAQQHLEHALSLSPQNDHLEYLMGLLESERGNSSQAIAHFRKAVELNPKNLRADYQLAEEIERQGGPNSEAEFQEIIQKILAAQPDNLAAFLELSRVAAKRGDLTTLKSAVAQISAHSSNWPPEAKQQLATLQAAINGPDPRAAATRTVFLRNVLMRVPEFRVSLSAMKAPPGDAAEPFTGFLKMQSPPSTPAPPDTALSFISRPLPGGEEGHWSLVTSISLGSSGAPVAVEANSRKVHFTSGFTTSFPGGTADTAPLPEGILGIDFNYDFKNDLVLAGAGGIRFLRQENPNVFTDVTAATKLPRAVLDGKYSGAWGADIEADGDLDIVSGTDSGLPTVFRNNGDGTFTIIHPFAGVSGLRAFTWADLDGDGNPDASLIDGSGRTPCVHQ